MPVPVIRIFDVADYASQIGRGGEALAGGGLVVLPTETVYGAAARLDVAAGRDRLATLRGSANAGTPFTIHVARCEDAERYLGAEVPVIGRRLMRKVWPGPVGLIFTVDAARRQAVAKQLGVDERAIYDGEQITLRCPDDAIAADIIAAAGGPVVLAAVGGGTEPTRRADHLAKELEGKVDLIFDAGPSRYAKPSTLVRVTGKSTYQIVRAGVYDERIIEKMLRTTILFVCSGNTCRSPMAEALARQIVARQLGLSEGDLETRGVSILSAGSFAMAGARATPQAVEAVRTLGADLSQHRSRPLSVELIHQADRIYAMGRGHAMAATALVPSAADKIQTLDPAGDIDDPIGSGVDVYVQLAGDLQQLIERRLTERPVA